MPKPDHITIELTEYVSLEQSQRVARAGERIRKSLEEEACSMGTPSECLHTIAELSCLLETKDLGEMIGKVERYTGREL